MSGFFFTERRGFLKTLGLAGAGVLLGREKILAGKVGPVPQRKFGRHNVQISSLGLGGHALRLADDAEAQRIVDEALDAGVNFFDNAWDYQGGRAEELMGRCIAGKRDRVFLMTKVCTHGRGKDVAMKMLEESLKRLGTDYLDLWQVHAVSSLDHVKSAYAPGGVLEALDEARKQGKVRYVGFTGHSEPEVHLAMLKGGYEFDACQLPVSAIEANSDAFTRQVLPELVKRQIAPLAMKSLGGNGRPFRDGILTLREALTYSLSHPVATLISGMESVHQLRENAAVVAAFSAMSSTEMAALEKRCQPATESDKYQPYRRWSSYRDGDAATGRYV